MLLPTSNRRYVERGGKSRVYPFTKHNLDAFESSIENAIKNNTILKTKYNDKKEMQNDMMPFLYSTTLHRSSSSLKKELNVKTSLQTIEMVQTRT